MSSNSGLLNNLVPMVSSSESTETVRVIERTWERLDLNLCLYVSSARHFFCGGWGGGGGCSKKAP